MSALLALSFPGTTEWIVIAVIALLIFGRRLPEVARSVGKSIVEFKRGIREVESDIESSSRTERKSLPPKGAPGQASAEGSTSAGGISSSPAKQPAEPQE